MDSPAAVERRGGERGKIWAVLAIGALAAVVAVALQRGWLTGLASHDQLIAWMRDHGSAGPLICIGIQFLQVVIFAIPGEITQIAAGYVFGAWWDSCIRSSGFCLEPRSISASPEWSDVRRGEDAGTQAPGRGRRLLQSRKGLAAILVLFLLPGSPKDALSYGAGLTGLRPQVFLALSIPARTPALFLSTLFGSEAYDRDYASMVWIAAAAGLLLAGTVFYQWWRRKR